LHVGRKVIKKDTTRGSAPVVFFFAYSPLPYRMGRGRGWGINLRVST
jgi:hypothetical protein